MVRLLAVGFALGVTATLLARHLLIRYSQHGLATPDYMGVKYARSLPGVPLAWGIA